MSSTNWTNITDFDGILVEANRYAPFWAGMLYMIWIVLVISFLPFGTPVAILAGGFLALILGILLLYMNLIAFKWLLAIIATIILMIIWEALFAKKE
jgi:hypothetical protein